MNGDPLQYLVSPISHKPLVQHENCLITNDMTESYHIVKGVPVLLSHGTTADWHRELMEVLLWQHPEKLSEMYEKLDFESSPVPVYIDYIKLLLKDKHGITAAINHYANEKTDRWIIQNDLINQNIPEKISRDFDNLANVETARSRVNSVRNNGENGWAIHLPYYTTQVHASSPSVIVELSTGSGFGTAAIADTKAEDSIIFTIDIGFNCHGNIVGIADLLGTKDSLFSICANFWSMPFPDNSIDVVCSHFGLDESRENDKTITEVARILKKNGRFVSVSRKHAFIRQYNILEPFGFSEKESISLLKKARLYSDVPNLIDHCKSKGLSLKESQDFHSSSFDITITSFVKQQNE
jgi:SAM-dependent methyltransferase